MPDKKYVYLFIIKALVLINFSFVAIAESAEKENIEITTMNIAWYGNTKFHTKNVDERDLFIKDFIDNELESTEIFLFQEITKPERFEQILNDKFKCAAYDFRGNAHQYVVTCFDTTKYTFTDNNDELFSPDRTLYISDSKDRLRDVLYVSLKSKKTGHIVNTFNLHLKAGIDEAALRKEQSMMLLKELKNKKIPANQTIVLGGDFNSYIRNIDGERFSEIDLFLDLSDDIGFDFYTEKDKPTTLALTQKIFDFLMIDTKNKILDYFIHPICDKTKKPKSQYEDSEFFKENISDHCPVTSILSI